MKTKFVALTALLLFSTFCIATEVVHVSSHGFIVKNQATVDASTDVVWSALVEDVDKWWPKDHTWWKGRLNINPVAGGCFCETSEKRSAEHMRISFVEPGKLLRMTGGLGPLQGMGMYGALDWVLTEQEGKTIVTLTYSVTGINPGGFEKLAPIVGQVQGQQLQKLAEFSSTR